MNTPTWFYDHMLGLLGWSAKARDPVGFDAMLADLWAKIAAHFAAEQLAQ